MTWSFESQNSLKSSPDAEVFNNTYNYSVLGRAIIWFVKSFMSDDYFLYIWLFLNNMVLNSEKILRISGANPINHFIIFRCQMTFSVLQSAKIKGNLNRYNSLKFGNFSKIPNIKSAINYIAEAIFTGN